MANELDKRDSIDKIDHFRRNKSVQIQRMLVAQVGKERATKAAAKIGLALAAAVRAARNPDAIMNCSEGSIMQCVAAAVAVDLYPRATNSPVWLVPKGGHLHFWMSHIGIATLAQRAGIALRPIPVHVDDDYTVDFGDITEHRPYEEPTSLDELAGVYVVVKRISDGALIGRPWVSAALINKRRKKGGNVWNEWPIEMAQKTAIKYLVARGIIVIDNPELSMALDNEPRDEAVAERAPAQARQDESGASLLGLPDHGEPEDLTQQDTREKLTLTAPEEQPEDDFVEAELVDLDDPEPEPEPEPKPEPKKKPAGRAPKRSAAKRGGRGAP